MPTGTRPAPPPVYYTNIVSSNLNSIGDSGTFEAAAASWGIVLDDPHTVTRSSTVAKQGTYSARIEAIQNNFGVSIMNAVGSHTIQNYKTYVVTVWIYTPSTNKFILNGNPYFFLTRSGGGTSTLNSYGCYLSACTDNWVQLRIKYRSSVDTAETCNIYLFAQDGSGGGGPDIVNPNASYFNIGGYLYIDKVEIYEVVDSTTAYQFNNTVVPANGPNSNTGSITVNLSPSGSYLYSIDGSSYSSSNIFTGLNSGGYTIYVNDGTQIIYYNQTVPSYGARFTIAISTTDETVAGASDGIITLTIGPQLDGSAAIGSPFTYVLYNNATGGRTEQSTGTFTGLPSSNYFGLVYDTYGNYIWTNRITINAGTPAVCALLFDSAATLITNASSSTTADGIIQVFANDAISGGVVKYSLGEDFNYTSGGSTTNIFSGYFPGTYQIYARTSNACLAQIEVTIGSQDTYGTKYRLDFTQLQIDKFYDRSGFKPSFGSNSQFRLDIKKRGYSSYVNIVKAGGTPIKYSWRGEGEENPFDLILVSLQIDINLISEYDQQYEEIYTSDEKEFLVDFLLFDTYINDYRTICQGYIITPYNGEQYINNTNYPVSFIATDGLADLAKIEFTDDHGNYLDGRVSVLKAILFCLNKTGLSLDIRDKVNVYSTGMNITYSDGSLIQRYIDPIVYKNSDGTFKSCKEVLESLLVGCTLYQDGGIWHIESSSEKCNSNTPFQQYDYTGAFVTSGVENNKILIRKSTAPSPKITFSESSAQLSIAQSFGKVKVTYDLGIEKQNNLLLYSTFEDTDITHGQLKGWYVSTEGATEGEYTYGLEKVKGGSDLNNYAFQSSFHSVIIAPTLREQKVIITSYPVAITYTSAYNLRIKFDVYTRPSFTNTYIYIDYCLKIGNYYLQPKEVLANADGLPLFSTDTTELIDGKYIRVFIENHLEWKTISVDCAVDSSIIGSLQLIIRASSNPVYDVASLAALQALGSTSQSIRTYNNKRRVLDGSVVRFYNLEAGAEATSSPDILRPTGWTAGVNEYVWKLQKTLPYPTVTVGGIIQYYVAEWLQSILIDNAFVEYLPSGDNPITSIIKEETINQNSSDEYEVTLLHGDIYYSSTETLSTPLDPNYELLMHGQFTTANGSATYGGWFRRNVLESKFYHELISKMIRSQFSIPRRKLNGTWNTFEQLVGFSNIFHEVRSGRVFSPLSLSIDPRNAIVDFQIRESVKGVVVDDVGDPVIPDIDVIDSPESNYQQFSDEFSDQFA